MKLLRILAITVFIFLIGAVIYNARYNSRNEYVVAVEKLRRDKNQSFSVSDDSPVRNAGKFTGLKYFEVNPDYKVDATVEVVERPDTVAMRLNNGTARPYLRFGVARFRLSGQPQSLWLFKPVGENSNELFLPFADATNGKESYPSGRFLDVAYSNTNTVTLDFNQAYNPYCAYDSAYVCPVPPSENRLGMAVLAGEKLYQVH